MRRRCDVARAQQTMLDDEWQFLVERIERIIDDHYAVMVIGSVSIKM